MLGTFEYERWITLVLVAGMKKAERLTSKLLADTKLILELKKY